MTPERGGETMAKYAKSKKTTRTMTMGLGQPAVPSVESFPEKIIQKIKERIEKILANKQILDEESSWITNQALLAIAFRRAETNEEKNKVMLEMTKHRKKGHEIGFSEVEIRSVNRFVVQEDLAGQMDNLHQRLLERRAG